MASPVDEAGLGSPIEDARIRLPALTPAGRELLEVLWSAARCFPHRAGRKIQTVSTLLAELMAQSWVAGEKRGGTRWVREPEDRRHIVLAALRMVGYVPAGSPEALVDHAGR